MVSVHECCPSPALREWPWNMTLYVDAGTPGSTQCAAVRKCCFSTRDPPHEWPYAVCSDPSQGYVNGLASAPPTMRGSLPRRRRNEAAANSGEPLGGGGIRAGAEPVDRSRHTGSISLLSVTSE